MKRSARRKEPMPRTAPSSPQRLLLWHLLAGLVVMLSLWAFVTWHTIQRYYDQWEISSVSFLVSSPKYISANEEEEMRIGVGNSRSNDVEVVFRLVNNGPLIGFLGVEKGNSIYSGSLQSQEQVNRQLKIFFPWDVNQANDVLGKIARLSLWGSVDNTPLQKVADLEIMIAPVPWAKSISNYLGTALGGLVLWLSKELWDQAKESSKKK